MDERSDVVPCLWKPWLECARRHECCVIPDLFDHYEDVLICYYDDPSWWDFPYFPRDDA